MSDKNSKQDSSKSSNKIVLKRGSREVVYEKVPDQFAVRLKAGEARSPEALQSAVGEIKTAVNHIDSDKQERLDLFTVAEAMMLENTVDEMRATEVAEVVTHTYRIEDSPEGAMIPVGTLTIQFAPTLSQQKREAILAEFGLEIVEHLDYLPDGMTVKLTEKSKENPLKIAYKLQQRSEIVTAEPDLSFQVALKHIPTDTLYTEQWHLNNPGDRVGLVAGADVKAEAAWTFTRGSRSINVCVMDDGFDLEHPDFNVFGKIVTPRDFLQDDTDPDPVFWNDNHGTACAGVAIAEENGIGVVGLAPGCAFMPVRMAMMLSDNAVVALFKHAIDHHADVISCSWSAAAWDFPLSTKIHGIIHYAATHGRSNGKGCVILFAAGNENRPLDGVKRGRVSHQGFALHPDVIAVAASNSQDERSSYSNFGPELAFCAPSSGSPGRKIVTTDRRGIMGYSGGDYTFEFGGTSSSTPLAAGQAALMLSLDENLTAVEVKQIMMDTADKIDEAGGDYVNGHSVWYGNGRINAFRALDFVTNQIVQPNPEVLFIEHRVQKLLPDLEETEDTIIFPLDVAIQEIEVHLEIEHQRAQDLRVVLASPQGIEITLIDQSHEGAAGIVKAFRSVEKPGLFAPIMDTSAQGTWRLKMHDVVGQSVGQLVKWGIAVTY
ncbi:MAG: hypothetical protein DWQ04_16325 [Chloroflexi bacterium]|nr:MAG: hypothetical protein DWQ04_16325 [Chloroflexota bacterium]